MNGYKYSSQRFAFWVNDALLNIETLGYVPFSVTVTLYP